MKLEEYRPANAFDQLTLRDLLEARDLYHVQLMQHPNVVATAIGRYRIRKTDSWPTQNGIGKRHGTFARTLENSEVRYYSWPAILVFVSKWESARTLVALPGGAVPKTFYLRDGRCVPICVIEAPKEDQNEVESINV